MRLARWVNEKVNGARGWTLLCFGLSAVVFGLAFFGPIRVVPPPPKGLVPLFSLIPYELWGLLWLGVAGALLWSTVRQDQSWAMGLYAGMLFVSAASYGAAGWTEWTSTGFTALWFSSALYLTILGACLGVARLVNAPPVDVATLVQGLEREDTGDAY